MEEKKVAFIPPKLLALDFIGALLAAVGVAKHFAHIDILPIPIAYENYGLVLIAVGVALMLPLVLHILNRARGKSEATRL